MLPIATVQGVRDGISTGMIIDLSEYLKKTEGVSKEEMQSLESVVANKLDIEPQHTHHIEDIKQLNNVLNGKYDKSEKYSYNVILNDSEKIPYLENPKIKLMELVQNKETEGYKFYVDESNGDLMIILNDVLIGTYSKSGNKWSLNGIEPENFASANHTHDTVEEIKTFKWNVGETKPSGFSYDDGSRPDYNEYRYLIMVNLYSFTQINEYKAIIRITLENGYQFSYPMTGTKDKITLDHEGAKFYSGFIDPRNEANGYCEYYLADNRSNPPTIIEFIETNITEGYALDFHTHDDKYATISHFHDDKYYSKTEVDTKINELHNILQNHYQALMLLLEKHDMVDSNTNDGANITPQ